MFAYTCYNRWPITTLHPPSQLERSGNLLVLPAVTPEEYLNDKDFSHLYKYLTVGELSGDDKIDRITLLICDHAVLHQ